MFPGNNWQEWTDRYEQSHRHPLNRFCHLIGIPLIALSLPAFMVIVFIPSFWPVPVIMFASGWLFQFAGHLAEGKPPEFFHDWRYLFVGLRWWLVKIRGRNKDSK